MPEDINQLVERAVWDNYYSSLKDLGYFEPSYSAGRITQELATKTGRDPIEVSLVVNDSLYDPEVFDSIQPGAKEAIKGLLEQGIRVYLWTIGDREIQEKKVNAIKEKVFGSLCGKGGESKEISCHLKNNLHESISVWNKIQALEQILKELLAMNITGVYIADDKKENIESAKSCAKRLGTELMDFIIDNDHPDGSFHACIAHLQNALKKGIKAAIFDIDDTVFNETGFNGRIAKIAKIINQRL